MMGCCQCQNCAKIVLIKLTNLFVCFQVPLYVATKMAKIRKASLAVPSPDTYATAGLKWVGYEPRCTPYWVHSIMWWLIQMIPEPIMDSVRLRSCLNIRKRGQAKEARSKAE
jgi:17beta-estradiol 17-dehydrogenase / very-long-chain 3-oxoacyl-CoA reductase